MSRAVIRTERSACQTQLMFTWGTNHVLVSEFIYAEFAYCVGTVGVDWWFYDRTFPLSGPATADTSFVSLRHVSSGFPICFLLSMWMVQPWYRLEQCELLCFLSAGSLGSIDLSQISLPMRAQASVVHSDWAFSAPGQIIDFVHLWTQYCWIAFLHLSGLWGVGCLMVTWFTHIKSVCMFALASLSIFTCFWPMVDHFCSVWSNLVVFLQWKPMHCWYEENMMADTVNIC